MAFSRRKRDRRTLSNRLIYYKEKSKKIGGELKVVEKSELEKKASEKAAADKKAEERTAVEKKVVERASSEKVSAENKAESTK